MISLRLFSIDFMHHASFNISQSVKVLFLFFRVACTLYLIASFFVLNVCIYALQAAIFQNNFHIPVGV